MKTFLRVALWIVAIAVVIGAFVFFRSETSLVALAAAPILSPRVQRSQLWRNGIELQDQSLYSYVALPTPLTAAGGVLFFGDTESTVGRQRTNMTRANEVPGKTNFEIFGIGIKFLPPLTVLWADVLLAMRGAYLTLTVNNSERRVYHLSEFFPASVIAPSFSAAAGDNPVLIQQGTTYLHALDPTIVLQGGVSVVVRIFFTVDSAPLNTTIAGVIFNGLIDRGNVQLDQTPMLNAATAAS